MLNNFKQLNWFYKIIFILSIISPIVLFIYRICSGFFTHPNDLLLFPYEALETAPYKVVLIIVKVYHILHPFIMCVFNFLCLKLNKYKLLTIIISAILFFLGINNIIFYIKTFFELVYLTILIEFF